MEQQRARELLHAERAKLEQLLRETDTDSVANRATANEPGGGFGDPAEPLTAEGTDDAIAASIRDRLAKIDRAELRLDSGTFGRSIRSGRTIPDDRLEADPAAELTVDEADQSS